MHRSPRLLSTLLLGASLAACADQGSVTAPAAASLRETLSAQLDELPPQIISLCKIGPAGSTATFSVTATGGHLPYGSTPTVNASAADDGSGCIEVWRSVDPQPNPDVVHTITVTETGSSGPVLDRVLSFSDLDGWVENVPPVKSATVHVNFASGAIIWFKNVEAPPSGAGCTPGFWRQAKHYPYWTGYTPNQLFDVPFANAFPGKTLGQIVMLEAGGLAALGRHAVAALLNATSPEVDYGMTPAEVIAAFDAAYASGNYEAQKDIFEGLNERGCTVNKSR